MKSTHDSGGDIQLRLLEAAGEVFAERGFRAATIRDICRRAGANVAAAHYHFGNKETLYAGVLKHWHRVAAEKYPDDVETDKTVPGEQRLRAFIHTFMRRILDEGRPAWHGKLVAREMIEPTRALDRLVEDVWRPQNEALVALLRELLAGRASRPQLQRCAWSIFGQCLFYRHSRVAIERLHPGQRFDAAEIERLADHIVEFSIGALRAMERVTTKAGKGARSS